ncbi:MAG: hypothetical protein COB12_06265 [Flavobacterium sp.]|nr:MAG: hypothetical protein COB12_06265 [Flavobacterium sp.]
MKKLLFIVLVIFIGGNVIAQNEETTKVIDSLVKEAVAKQVKKPSKTQFMIRGYGHTGFAYDDVNGETSSSFDGGTFAPIFLFKHNDRFMFESELEFTLSGGELEIGFEYANAMYVINDYMTVRAGKFLLPFGTFMERLHPSWINRFTSKPLGFGHDGIAPSSDVGVELRGAFYIGNTKWNYSGYVTNGPTLKDGSDEPEEAGMLSFENLTDNNTSKAFGGRIGFLPLHDSSIEVGGSIYATDGVGNKGSEYEDIKAVLYAFDLSYVKQIAPISGLIDIKAQYNHSNVDSAFYFDPEDGETYTFDNQSQSYFVQLSYRPTMIGNNFVKNLELVGRYSELTTPEGSEWESQSSQYSVGLNYWISWRSVLKMSYESKETEGGHGGAGITNVDTFSIHWAIGF